MSKSFNSSTTGSVSASANNTKKTPYCKVCFDAGRPEKEYTDHFVKDQPGPNGKVVCPTLLNQACRICRNTGHTSSYCPQYRPHAPPRVEEPPRYIERECEREPRDDRRDISFNRLREDTDRHERDIRVRDDAYDREQDRRSKPWLQAALVRPSSSASSQQPRDRRGPYAHPHGPRVRLELESRSLKKPAVPAVPAMPAVDVLTIELNHAAKWGDEEPEEMAAQMFQKLAMSACVCE